MMGACFYPAIKILASAGFFFLRSIRTEHIAHLLEHEVPFLDQPILTMCPREVCTKCGEPRRRIVDATRYESESVDTGRPVESIGSGHRADRPSSSPTTLGWTDCGCGAPFRRGHILDPFGGSGTTAVVATAHGRDCTLIDLDERNVDLARDRVGMFLNVPEPDAAA